MNNIFKNIFILIVILKSSLFAENFEIDIEEKNLYNSHIWKSLLHINNDKPSINSKDFLLSFDNFSLKNELISNIEKIKTDKNYSCKFPARYLWITKEFPSLKNDKNKCKEFDEYLEKTNLSSLDLIFVSENIKNPSSMMGHIFFKINGIYQEKNRENAISFFTILNHLNIPLLAYESMIKGMQGYFILSPYQKQIFSYVNEEERNVWEYKLNLTKEQQDLIYYHFWELKDIDITYFFTNFNCATIIDNMLAITSENYYQENPIFWTTPKNVINKANRFGLISNTKMIPSLEWSLYMINDNLENEKIKNLKNMVDNQDIIKIEQLLNKQNTSELEIDFIENYTKYSYLKNDSMSSEIYEKISSLYFEKNRNIIDFSNYKNPIYSIDNKQISLGFTQIENKNFLNFNLLFAGNTIYDDNRTYFAENSLKIGNINILANKSDLILNKIDFYEMTSYLPVNQTISPLSTEFGISYYSKFNNLYINDSLVLKGGFGQTHKLSADIFFYYLSNFEAYLDKNQMYPILKPKVGINIYEIYNMKTILQYEYEYNLTKTDYSFHKRSFNQSINIKNKHRFDFSYNLMKNQNKESKNYNLIYNYFF